MISVAIDRLENREVEFAEENELFDRFYRELVELVRDNEFLVGQGAFGEEGEEPAAARNTECSLTDAGRRMGRSLLSAKSE